jgi:hypothetical protein
MQNYDIIHLDDDQITRTLVGFLSKQRGLTYKSAGTLHDLKETMETSRARFYVVDGAFPRGGEGCSGRSEMLAPEAVDYIRENCGDPIIVYSGHLSLRDMDMEDYDVLFVPKDGNTPRLFSAMESLQETAGQLPGTSGREL